MEKLTSKDWQMFSLSAILVALTSIVYNNFLTDAEQIVIYINALEKITVFLILGFLFLLFKQYSLIRLENYKSIFILSFLVAFIPTILEVITGVFAGRFFESMFVRMLGAILGILIARLFYK